MDEYEITPLWPTPLFETTIKSIPPVCKDYIIKSVEYRRYPADNGFGSINKFLLNDPVLAPLKKSITDIMREYLYSILDIDESIDFQMTNSWSVKHLKGDEAGAHFHGNSMFSGILYIQTEKNSGDILFLKDKNHYNIFTDTVLVPFKGKNNTIYNVQGHALKPKDNLLILFPSLLRHEVYPNESDIERYCVAFNFFGFGKYGYDDVVQLGIANIT